MYQTLLTRELTEISGVNESSPSALADIEHRTRTPLVLATTVDGYCPAYANSEMHLSSAGWRLLGRRLNPNSGNYLYLWYKQLAGRRSLPQKAVESFQTSRGYGVRNGTIYASCCGLRIYAGDQRRRAQRYLCIERVPSGAQPPSGWRQFASFRHCSYWTNVGGRSR